MKKLIFIAAIVLTACNSPKTVEPTNLDSTSVDSITVKNLDSVSKKVVDTAKAIDTSKK